VVGPALSVRDAQQLAEHETVDAAILDINMSDGSSLPVAQALFDRGVPFCFSTGYGLAGVPEPFREMPVLQKPYQLGTFKDTLRKLLEESRS
jgi:DNA-binding LytR/AlgR family response regulator